MLATAAGCGAGAEGIGPREVRVAAAADLRYAMDELVDRFGRAHPDVSVSVTFGSSGLFAGQLQNRAPFDVFLSADVAYPRRLIEAGIGSDAELFHYGVGRIVLWVAPLLSDGLEERPMELLVDERVRRIAIANPRHAPYGRAAEAALRHAGIYEQVREKLVLGENVAQAAQFVESGAADMAIIALSLVVAGPMRDMGEYVEIDEQMHPPIEQAGLVLPWARDVEAARAFRDFLMSEEGRAILRLYGFAIPGE
jgi:molybdate transport system substrate-binding protein